MKTFAKQGIIILVICVICVFIGTGVVMAQDDVIDNTERTVIDVSIDEQGDAVVTIENRVLIETDEQEEAFAQIEQDVAETPDGYIVDFQQNIEQTVESAEETTNRDMESSEFTVDTERQTIPDNYGVIKYSFVWSNFSNVETTDERVIIEAGDAFGGFYLNDDTVLQIGTEDSEYEAVTTTPETDNTNPVVWEGEQRFSDSEPRVTFEKSQTTGGNIVDNNTIFSSLLVLFGILSIGGGIGAYIYYKHKTNQKNTGVEKSSTNGNHEENKELLSNEELVFSILNNHGGRMKQQELKEALEWSDSKTSKVLQRMHEDDEIFKFQLGRENVVVTPEEYKKDDVLKSNKEKYDNNE